MHVDQLENFPLVRRHSSHEWLRRQHKDPYVKQAKIQSYRARSAFKLMEMDEKYRIFCPGQVVVDLGAAPGSWCQVAVRAVNAKVPDDVATAGDDPKLMMRLEHNEEIPFDEAGEIPIPKRQKVSDSNPHGLVIGVDLLPMHPLAGAMFLAESDFTQAKTQQNIHDLLRGREVDVVMSDMAPNASGIIEMDHDKIIILCRDAYKFATNVLADYGTFLCKIWQGRETTIFFNELQIRFDEVINVKPPASRDDSSEMYILAKKFRKNPRTSRIPNKKAKK